MIWTRETTFFIAVREGSLGAMTVLSSHELLILCNFGAANTEVTEDEKLAGGNLALKNSAELGRSVRVVGKHKDSFLRSKFFYSYDGMYKVRRFYSERKKGVC